ncbi:hypothetical protein [Qipengyuania sp. DGS5-3]|uniref:hypothetical protein n=1 Tax=Qipengyuania sp. DGS5-3 TaxID=3349632 RepID=UPI0036D38400
MMKNLTLLIAASAVVSSCGGETPSPADEETLMGCYVASDAVPVTMKIDQFSISLNDEVLYTEYELVTKRGAKPFVHVWPRLVPWQHSEGIEFLPYRGGKGGLTILVEQGGSELRLSAVFSTDENLDDFEIREFIKTTC